MATLIPSTVFTLGILQDINTAVTGTLVGATVGLFQNNIVPNAATVFADLVEADYTGYGTEAVTWLAVDISDDGFYEITGTVGEFRPTDAVTPNSVFGFYLTGVGGIFLGAGRFDNPPIPMEDAFDHIIPTPRIRVSPSGIVAVVS